MLSRSEGAVLMQVHWARSLTHMSLRTEASATKYGIVSAHAVEPRLKAAAALCMQFWTSGMVGIMGQSPCQKLDLGGGDQSKMTERTHQGCQVLWEFGPCWE